MCICFIANYWASGEKPLRLPVPFGTEESPDVLAATALHKVDFFLVPACNCCGRGLERNYQHGFCLEVWKAISLSIGDLMNTSTRAGCFWFKLDMDGCMIPFSSKLVLEGMLSSDSALDFTDADALACLKTVGFPSAIRT